MRITGQVKLTYNRLPKLTASVTRQAQEAVGKTAYLIEARAKVYLRNKIYIPKPRPYVLTGALLNSICVVASYGALYGATSQNAARGEASRRNPKAGMVSLPLPNSGTISATVGPVVEYGYYVEIVHGYSFLIPAAEDTRAEFLRLMRNITK